MKQKTINIKVLHFVEALGSGGRERQLIELCKGIKPYHNVSFELAVMSRNIHYKEINNIDIHIHFLIRKNKKDPRILFRLYKICKKINPDIIHSWGSMTTLYAAPIAKILRIKLVNGMIRDAKRPNIMNKLYIRSILTFPFSDIVVSNSQEGLKTYHAPKNKSVCVYNGFDFKRIKYLQKSKVTKKYFNINTDKVVGMVANFTDNKDYETFFEAARIVIKKRNDVTFIAIGDGKNYQKYRILFGKNIHGRIKILGQQSNVEDIIQIFDIGILCTNTVIHGEGISNSIMEYMALKIPVIATNSGGTKEIVIHNKTGFLIKKNDPKILSLRILQLLDDSRLKNKMGKEGRIRIQKEFDDKKMIYSFIKLYKGVVGIKKI